MLTFIANILDLTMNNIIAYFQLLNKPEINNEEIGKFFFFSFFKVLFPFVFSFIAIDFDFLVFVSNKSVTLLFMAAFFLILLFIPKIASIMEYIIHITFWILYIIYIPTASIAVIGLSVSVLLILCKTITALVRIITYWPAYENPIKILWLK